jgi:hypothetical protein
MGITYEAVYGLTLLQSLLFQIFDFSRPLIDVLCPLRQTPQLTWEIRDLKAAFSRLSMQRGLDTKFCFFIDGLDEFEGDEEDIIQLVKDLATSDNIKLCVSSRPWPAFQAEWNPSDQNLKVQDFTRNDMDKYIRERLVESEHFGRMTRKDPRYYDLIPQISERAEGVWLWVFLVVRDLLRDTRDNEPLEQVVLRLKSYPQELASYYEVMMDRIDKVFQRESAQIMLLALTNVHAPGSLPFTVLKHLSDWNDHVLVSKTSSTPITDEEMKTLYEEWSSRLQNRCRDLLQIRYRGENAAYPVTKYQIGFLHRTVSDFLSDKYRGTLCQRVPDGFDEWFVAARASTVVIKRSEGAPAERQLRNINRCIIYAGETKLASQIFLLDELEGTLRASGRLSEIYTTSVWIPKDSKSILPFITRYETCYDYLKYSLRRDPGRMHHDRRPLLDLALTRRGLSKESIRWEHIVTFISTRIVSLLLELGADPNQALGPEYGETPFLRFVKVCSMGSIPPPNTADKELGAAQEQLFQLLKVLVQHGANPLVKNRGKLANVQLLVEEEVPVDEFLAPQLGPEKAAELRNIVKPILTARKTGSDGTLTAMWRWMGY